MLKTKQFDFKGIKSVVDKMINSPGFVHTLYESDMCLDTTRKELMDFIPKIQSFVGTYMVDYKKYVKMLSYYSYIIFALY